LFGDLTDFLLEKGCSFLKCQRAVKTSQGWADENQPL